MIEQLKDEYGPRCMFILKEFLLNKCILIGNQCYDRYNLKVVDVIIKILTKEGKITDIDQNSYLGKLLNTNDYDYTSGMTP